MAAADAQHDTYMTEYIDLRVAAAFAHVHYVTVTRARRSGELEYRGSRGMYRTTRQWVNDWLERIAEK